MNRAGFWPCLVVMGMLGAQGSAGVGEGVPPWWDGKWGCRLAVKVEPSPTPRRDFEVAARLQFAKLSWMLGEASVADTDSIQVVEWVDGHRWGAPVTREVVVEDGYHALAPRTPTESSGCVSVRWRVQGETAAGVTRRYYVYWRSLTEPFPIAEIPRSAVAEVKQAGVELGLAERAPEPVLLKSFGRMKAHLAAASGDAGKDRARPFAMEALLPTHAFPESPAQLSAHIHAEPLAQDVSSLRLAVQLEPHAGRPLARAVVAPLTEPPWQLTASLPRLQPGSYRLRCELLRANGQRLASFLEFFRVVGAPKTAGQFALTLTEPAQAGREADVAQAGVPFPEGALRDPANVRLLDGKKESPSQWDTLATWKDGSVKWLFLTFPATLKAGESKRFTVEYGPKTHRMPTTGVSVEERAEGVTVDTGRLRFTVGRRPFCLLRDVAVDADHDGRYEPMPLEPSGQVFVVHESGTVYDAALGDAEVHVLERGPVRVALHVKGWHAANDGTRFCQFDLRLYAYAGKSHLRLLHTFIFTGEPEKDRIRSVGIRLRPARGSGAQVRFGGEFQTESFPCSAAPTLVQDDWNHFALTADGQAAREGQQAAGWIDLSDGRVGLQLGVRDFFQQFPKGLAAEAGSVTAYLWPPGKPMDLSFDPKGEEYPVDKATGVGKTHEALIHFHPSEPPEELARSFRAFEEPLVAVPSPEWSCASGALGAPGPLDPRNHPEIEETLSAMFDWDERMVGWPKEHSYGIWNFPELHYSWEGVWGRKRYWFNNEYGAAEGPWLMYLRSGDRKYLRFAERHSRHIMDVDTIHHRPDEPGNVGGQHTHSPKQHWGAVPNSAHTCLEYALHYYYLTGDPRGLDVALEHGAFFLAWWDAQRHAPAKVNWLDTRTWYNPLRALIPLYEATWDEKYLTAAKEIAELLLESGLAQNQGHFAHFGAKGLKRHAEATQDARIRNAFIALAAGFAQAPGLPGPSVYGFENMQYAYDLTGDRRFLEHGADSLRVAIHMVNRDPGDPCRDGEAGGWWSSSLFFQQIPFLLGALQRAGHRMDELRLPRQVFHMRCRKPEFLVCEDSDRDWNMALSAWPWTARQGLSSISVFGPRGKLVERREVNRGAALNYYLLRVPKDGLSGVYRIEIDDGEGAGCYGHSQWQVESGPQKVMARLPSDGAIASTGSHEFGWRFYFHVPKGTKEFTVKLSVVIRGTYCGRVFDPSGSLRGHASWTGHPIPTHQRVLRIADDRGLAPGVWSLAFKAYRALRIELEGIPPYVAARPEGAFEVGER